MNIAVVDHEKSGLEDLTHKLHRVFPKSHIYSFQNPLEVLKFVQKNHIDILFTDIRTRPIDGYELIKVIRQQQAFYAYVVSGSRDHPDNLDWMNINGYFSKPVSDKELIHLKKELRIT